MTSQKNSQPGSELGIVGLGVMGRNLLLNMSDHGFAVAGYDQDRTKVEALRGETGDRAIRCATDVKEFVNLLRQPRIILLLVPAGIAVDAVIGDLVPHLKSGDLIVDAGNSHFRHTDQRIQNLKDIDFLGVGVSGGEAGARHGPSIMPGGRKEAYERVRPVFEAIAAKVNGNPCVTYLGPGSVGHFVKMVHNGIEYALMQLIAETYDLMKRGLGLNEDELQNVYSAWNDGELSGYLIEITSQIFGPVDPATGRRVIDTISPVARQNGTGSWTSQSALELQVPLPTIDLAVAMRDMSILVSEREQASAVYPRSFPAVTSDRDTFLTQLHRALYVSTIITYAQGMALLVVASNRYGYQLNLEGVARIWRGGCIVRSALLEHVQAAFAANPALPNLLLAPNIAKLVIGNQDYLRQVIGLACQLGIPVPGLMTSLSYFDAYRSAWLPANLIQAQRDYFGAHTYERVDAAGTFHTLWGTPNQ